MNTEAVSKPLKDSRGRPMHSLRISVTDRCNFNCFYCNPGEKPAKCCTSSEKLTYNQIKKLTRLFVELGVDNVRLTGGEPLVRNNLEELITKLKKIEELREVTLTTNGYYLASQLNRLKEAGIDRINMSLDTFQEERFQKLTGHSGLNRVLTGLDKLLESPAVHPVKVNTVAIRNFNEDEIPAFVDWAARTGQTVRFIEFMPLERGTTWRENDLLLTPEIKNIISESFSLLPRRGEPYETATKFKLENSEGTVGFISSISNPFCDSCDRVRLTADGQVKTCLFSYDETDLKPLLSPKFKGEQIKQKIITAFRNRWKGGCEKLQKDDYDLNRQSRTMSGIGG